MANEILFLSALLFGLIQISHAVNLNCNNLISFFYLIGFVTSLLNHGFTNLHFVNIDRIVMAIGFFINILLIYYMNHTSKILCYIGLFLATINYFLAKYCQSSFPHILTHFIITLVNLEIIYYYSDFS